MFNKKVGIWLYIFYIVLISTISYFLIFQKNIDNYKKDIRHKLLSHSIMIAHFIDIDAAEALYDILTESDNPRSLANEIYETEEANKILDDFKFIQELYPNFIGCIYTFAPTDNPTYIRFIIDTHEDLSLFGLLYDISNFPTMQKSLETMQPMVEENVSYNEKFDEYSISSFAPIYTDNGKYIGHVGISMFIENYHRILKNIIYESSMFTVAVVFISVILIPQLFLLLIKHIAIYKKNKELNKVKKSIKRDIK